MNTAAALPDSEGRDLGRFVEAVFTAWNRAGIDFLVLRNYEDLPATFSSKDIDILVAPEQLAAAERELRTGARAAGFVPHNRAEFSPVSLFFFHPPTARQVQVDLFTSLHWRGLTLIPTERVLRKKIQRATFLIPHPAHEAVLNLLIRLLYQGYVKEEYKSGIVAGFRADPQEAEALLAEDFGSRYAQRLLEDALRERWQRIEQAAPRLRRALACRELIRHPVRTARALLSDALRLSRRFVRPPGLTVVLLGPDGCGKSTVASKVFHALRYSFSPGKGLKVHWKPIVFFRRRRRPTNDLHGRPPRGAVLSLGFLLCHWLEFLLGEWLQLRGVRFKNGLVMIDRYFYDLLIDPRRYRLKVPAWAVRLGCALLPKPDLVFLLDAPAEVLQARKREVPLEETAHQRRAFLALVQPMPQGRVIDASQTADEVVAGVVRAILEFAADRARRRGDTADD